MTHQQPTADVATALRLGLAPWRTAWHGGDNTGLPRDVASGELFQGIDWLLLQLSAQRRAFRSRWWGTQEQVRSLGASPTGGGTALPGGAVLFNAEQAGLV